MEATATKTTAKRLDLPNTEYALLLENCAKTIAKQTLSKHTNTNTNQTKSAMDEAINDDEAAQILDIIACVFRLVKRSVTVAGNEWPTDQLLQTEPQVEPLDKALARKVENTRVEFDNLVLDLTEARARVKEQLRDIRAVQEQHQKKHQKPSVDELSLFEERELQRLERNVGGFQQDSEAVTVASQTHEAFENFIEQISLLSSKATQLTQRSDRIQEATKELSGSTSVSQNPSQTQSLSQRSQSSAKSPNSKSKSTRTEPSETSEATAKRQKFLRKLRPRS